MRPIIETRWLRFKRFKTIPWVLSIGRHEGRRLNIAWHSPSADKERER